jgi:argininosuccinate lyase
MAVMLAWSVSARAETHDDFDHLVAINKASLVMLAEEGIVPADLATQIATGIVAIDEEQAIEGAARSSNYLDFEARLLEISGPEASRLHTGRSRQDIGSTYRRMGLRENLLDSYEALLAAREALLAVAERHVDTIIPAYTHGVQAQPTTLAHYLLAFAAAFERDASRLQEVYARLNRSPLGAAALGTSGFAIDRERLAALLGFDGPIENSYDANLVSSVDSKIEFASALSISAITVGQLMQNLHTQYHNPVPWLRLAEGSTNVSSIMPQKRNPRPIDAVRSLATDVARRMYRAYVYVMNNLVVDPERALEEIDSDYSTMTEVADVLLRHADVPFRIAYHYASGLTTYGRANGKRPRDLTDAELLRLYEETTGEKMPLPVAQIRDAMDPVAMVGARKGLGGPQEAEVVRMLGQRAETLLADSAWLDASRMHLQDSGSSLEQSFAEFEQ